MTDPLFWHRVQFGFTVTYHYLFPQLTMGLAPLIVLFQGMALRTGEARYRTAAKFWARIFAINFAVGVVTGIPLEFQFGTNWARFSAFSGGVIGQTLAMEGMFAFFLESSVLGLFLYGEERLGPKLHFASAVLLALGSWMSGYFIIVTNAFMQHPMGHVIAPDGTLQLGDMAAFLFNPWAIWQYLHNMSAAMITGSFAVAAAGALYALQGKHPEQAALFVRTGVIAGMAFSVLQLFPTGDRQGKLVGEAQPVTLAAMEGVFRGGPQQALAVIGQPDVDHELLENPIEVPGVLSFLTYGTFGSTVRGLEDFPRSDWPDNIEVLYFAYHVMVGLGTLFLALMAWSLLQMWRGRLLTSRATLWMLLLAVPFPYIATTAGWMTAELGRQPWLVYGLMRTAVGTSPRVSAGDTVFTLLGFSGLYLVVGLLFLYLVGRELQRGPEAA